MVRACSGKGAKQSKHVRASASVNRDHDDWHREIHTLPMISLVNFINSITEAGIYTKVMDCIRSENKPISQTTINPITINPLVYANHNSSRWTFEIRWRHSRGRSSGWGGSWHTGSQLGVVYQFPGLGCFFFNWNGATRSPNLDDWYTLGIPLKQRSWSMFIP